MSIPRESKEYVKFQARNNGVPVTENVKYTLTRSSARPILPDLKDPVVLDGTTLGFMMTGLQTGAHHLWAKVTSNPEEPLIYCGKFIID